MSPREGGNQNEKSNQLVSLTRRINTQHGGDGGEEGGGAAVFSQKSGNTLVSTTPSRHFMGD